MSDALPIAPAVAPTNGAHPTTPQKPAVVKPVDAKPVVEVKPTLKAEEIDDSEEYIVDGKTTRLNKEQRKLHFQKALAADKRMREAAEEKAKAAEFWKKFDADPEAALRERGKDPEKIFGAHLEKKAKLELMTAEQKEAAELKERLTAAEAKAAKFEEEKKAARQAEIDARNFKALETQLISAADKHGLDSSPETLEGLCDIALEFIEYGTVISPDQVAQEFKRREMEHIEARDKKLSGVLKGDKLLKFLGPSVLAEVKAALAAADAKSLEDIPKPKAKVAVKAHERAVKGHINENEFDRKFKL